MRYGILRRMEEKVLNTLEGKRAHDFFFRYRNPEIIHALKRNIEQFVSTGENPPQNLEVHGELEHDLTREEVHAFIQESFPQKLRENLPIAGIHARSDIVWVRIPQDFFGDHLAYDSYVPVHQFSSFLASLPEGEAQNIQKQIRRGVSYVLYNRLHPALEEKEEWLNTPIYLFNQSFDPENRAIQEGKPESEGLDYLSGREEREAAKLYYLGTIAHEIGHHILEKEVTSSEENREAIFPLLREKAVTSYVTKKHITEGTIVFFHENFAEAIRLFTTAPEYLREHHSELFTHLEKFMKAYE